jgi:hypothetical protein
MSLLLVIGVRRLESNSRCKFSTARTGIYATMESCSIQLRQSSITDEESPYAMPTTVRDLTRKPTRCGCPLKWMDIIETTFVATVELGP